MALSITQGPSSPWGQLEAMLDDLSMVLSGMRHLGRRHGRRTHTAQQRDKYEGFQGLRQT